MELINKPLVTIAVLNKNGLNRLRKVIPSYLVQNFSNEIVVLDNASTDESLFFLSNYPNIRIIKSEIDMGYGAAKNILVGESRGSYILLLDNDIELVGKNFVKNIFNKYCKINGISFLSPLIKDSNRNDVDSLGLYYNRFQKRTHIDKCLKLGTFQIPGYMGNAVFFKKSIFIELGGFDEIYPFNIDNYDLSARAYLMGYLNYMTTECMVIHHGIETRTNLSSLSWKNKYYLAGFTRMIIKNYRIKNLLIWLPISFGWIFIKTIKNCIKYHSFRHIFSYFFSLMLLIRDILSTLKKRLYIQRNRKIADDGFLKVKPPHI